MTYEKGDYVYYTTKDGDTVPAVVSRVMVKYMKIFDGVFTYKVSMESSKVRLQD